MTTPVNSGANAPADGSRRQTFRLPPGLDAGVQAALEDWRAGGKVRRLWERDASLWTGADESNWLGWLGIVEDQRTHEGIFREIAADARKSGFTHALLLGMGGSSLGPEVLARTFGTAEGFPRLLVLDSTDPAQIAGAILSRWIGEGLLTGVEG